MLKDLSAQAVFMGCLTAFVGFASSFAVVLHGLQAVGATPGQAASGLTVLSISMGLCAIVLSLTTRLPVSIAWSTPGAALLASSGAIAGGFQAAVGGFVVCAALIIVAGLFRPLGRAVASIPAPLANAMLAGVLIGLCFAPVKAIAFNPLLGLPIVLAWVVVGAFRRLWAVPAALAAFVAVLAFGVQMPAGALSSLEQSLMPRLELVQPLFTMAGLVSIALPLFIVTMASQNIPGIAVLKVNQYDPKPGPLFAVTGLFSLVSTPFGGHAVNLAAITAAMCAGKDANADPDRRYWAAVIAGIVYIVFGLLAGAVTAFVALAPPILIEAVAGLALIGAFSGSAMAAFQVVETREAAAVTFLVTASGVSFGGISGAFWGLIAGGLMLLLQGAVRKLPANR
ncbi:MULTISPECIES: benzoate/H(+) symporter BenE family transporter [Rhizobium]|uniref:Benzoate/H(+) symporter BenE family transporter n=1 Tax=Rhizobium rhododendri TaxID=2506430 RepID=A0ABY8ICW6_9HYPH|nr:MULTISPECIES: benzoate/H(+) symporter BenE family transporter [Rhizobium]MBZ5758717.1 benzoate/H(+) symporter BenE family transporter [Rhizobium sp. VS19-DR96]MBZ5764453.1 benzoate/H(+) symporter BenE family transporter [Rhizobium sp. VS19-DR129.2]MBZ5771996.1 benzoate/H(+) symporter BenE family transporter [Rhizobium sp. VS19-DRK62.2]MBZ5783317.1 benzoate/H(+) symporter BenE family transporter [Rhizobium sp. VS19-DR121]MBZ5800765.1 benzoate/H(+) symporter BenE family transporter [Rhizobium